MFQDEVDCVRKALKKRPGTCTGREIAGIYIHHAVSSDHFWEVVAKENPDFYLARLKQHAETMIPASIEYLMSGEPVAAVDNIILFMVKACERTELLLDHFISPTELSKVRRAALLRGGRLPLDKPDNFLIKRGNGTEMFRSNALMAGISAKELGINRTEAQRCLKSYLHKGNPKLRDYWKSVCEQYRFVNRLLPVAA